MNCCCDFVADNFFYRPVDEKVHTDCGEWKNKQLLDGPLEQTEREERHVSEQNGRIATEQIPVPRMCAVVDADVVVHVVDKEVVPGDHQVAMQVAVDECVQAKHDET